MKNRSIVFTTNKSIKANVLETTTKKPYLRVVMPVFDETTGVVSPTISDRLNVSLEKGMYEIGDSVKGTFTCGLRYFSEDATGAALPTPFFRWELLEEVDVEALALTDSVEAKATLRQTIIAKARKVDAVLSEADVLAFA